MVGLVFLINFFNIILFFNIKLIENKFILFVFY
jgi:hypothetical protein